MPVFRVQWKAQGYWKNYLIYLTLSETITTGDSYDLDKCSHNKTNLKYRMDQQCCPGGIHPETSPDLLAKITGIF